MGRANNPEVSVMMQSVTEPVIGEWYEDIQKRRFEVVAVDEDTVEIQYYDGDVEEVDMESWYLMNNVPAAEPNDASGPYDDLDMEEFGPAEEGHTSDWQQMLDEY
jgi:hypothetical protein